MESIVRIILTERRDAEESTREPFVPTPTPNIARPQPEGSGGGAGSGAAALDETDRAILRALARDARTPNSAIAEEVGVAPSTCHARIRALRERGVLRGFHADVDPAALGLGLQAMIAVRLHTHTREQINAFVRDVPRLPGVVGIFHVAGADDYLLHVAVRDSDALRDFVLDHLTGHPAVRHSETSLIFRHIRGSLAGLGLVP
jgi:DNA-binding Lrp family transcriptional regulator